MKVYIVVYDDSETVEVTKIFKSIDDAINYRANKDDYWYYYINEQEIE